MPCVPRDRPPIRNRRGRFELEWARAPTFGGGRSPGFVELPNVDAPQEMLDMLGAARACQANVAAISIIRDIVAKALELGR